MAKGGINADTSNFIIKISFIILAIVIIYILIRRHPGFIDWMKGLTGGKFAGAVMGGEAVPGPNIYTPTGDISTGAVCTNRSSGTSFRDNVSYPCTNCARETTWFFIPGGGGGGGSTGEDATVKMGSHGDEDQQTALISFGGIPLSGGGGEWKSEGPHGTDAGVAASGDNPLNEGSVTLSGDQPMGIKGISWPVNNEGLQHHEIWTSTDDGATWTIAAVFEGTTEGSNPLTCPVPDDGAGCQDTLRLDGVTGHGFLRRTMVGIDPGDGTPVGGGTAPGEIATNEEEAGDAGSGSGGGGGTTPPTTTPPTDGDEEEEEEEPEEEPEEEEEEEEDGNGDGGEAQCNSTTKQCTCADGTSFQLTASQTCADCTTACTEDAARASRGNRNRNRNRDPRRAMLSMMLKAYAGREYRYHNYRPRAYGFGFAATKRHVRLGNL